ncbi:MAG: PhzF family phenazine biosynthesis protein [Candidatus Thorarchaeota archaeon]|jgi:trans-2,3-dihydro-3-hydroxyanthranilate isomerase
MTEMPYVQTSVFIDERYRFSGNQLATFYDTDLNSHLNDEEMQGIAREMNFSETTFLMKSDKVQSGFGIRIFTPYVELPFAGHPTIGTAYVLKNKKLLSSLGSTTTVELGVGPTEVEFTHRGVSMFQPYSSQLNEYLDLSTLSYAIGLSSGDILSDFPVTVLSSGAPYLIVPLVSLNALQRIVLKESSILEILKETGSNGLVVLTNETIHSDSDLHVRMFAPGLGVSEDPATGSAAGPLGVYVEEHGVLKDHERGVDILIEQGHEIARPSLLRTRVERSIGTHVKVSGLVRTTAEGLFFLQSES